MAPSRLLLLHYKDQYWKLGFVRLINWYSRRRAESRQFVAISGRALLACAVLCSGEASGDVAELAQKSESQIIFDRHLVNDIPYRGDNYSAVIEIPAGDVAKWEVNSSYGYLEWGLSEENVRRNVNYLPYPANYGFIPQTLVSGTSGGDGDPIDVVVLGPRMLRGSIQPIRVLGAIRMLDKNEIDDKVIAARLSGPFGSLFTIEDLRDQFPGVLEILTVWFDNYKGSSMVFIGYADHKQAQSLIEMSHDQWLSSEVHHRGD
jgi:inorganic pyrophosphatase